MGYINNDDDGYRDPTFNSVNVNQKLNIKVKTCVYHDEDEADELAEEKCPADIISEAAYMLKYIVEGKKTNKWKKELAQLYFETISNADLLTNIR